MPTQLSLPSSFSLNTFADPTNDAYLTWHQFIMPTAKGGILSVAANTSIANYVVSAYSIIVFMICGFAWQLVVYLVLIFYPTEDSPKSNANPRSVDLTTLPPDEQESLLRIRKQKANRYITLITIRNSNAPTFTLIMMLFEHIRHMYFRAKDRRTGAYDIMILVAALTVIAGSSATGTLVPRHFVLGTAAPANPSKVFFGMPGLFSATVGNQKAKTAAAQRAFGIVASGGEQLLERVHFSDPEVMGWTGPDGQTIDQIAYDYNVTGLDFGLQLKHPADFVLRVTGACTLQYGWSVLNNDSTFERYSPPSYDINLTMVYLPTSEAARPVGGYVRLLDQAMDQQNRTYAIIPDTLRRWSQVPGTDPWYKTSPVPGHQGYYAIDTGRPVLYCWQQDIWSYKGHLAKTVSDLENLPGLGLPSVIGGADGYLAFRMINPMINDVASLLGASILVGSTLNTGGVMDASQCSYSDDLKRLILASFLVTQNVLRDTVTMNGSGLYNNATDHLTGLPKSGAGKFVVSSGGVVTLSVTVLIWVPFIWLFLQLARMCISVTSCTSRNSGIVSRYTLRSVGLQHVQLYRMLDEELCGFRDDWYERKGQMPYIRNARPVVATPEDPSIRQHALYISPKVVNFHNRYQLKFTGHVGHESRRESVRPSGGTHWSWHGKNTHPIFGGSSEEDHPGVADGPYSEKPSLTWRIFDYIHGRWFVARTGPGSGPTRESDMPIDVQHVSREVQLPKGVSE